MSQLSKIRRLYYRDGLSLSEVSRRTSLSRNTVKRWLKQADGVEPKYHRNSDSERKIDAYAGRLTQMLEQDAHRAKRDRRSARKLHEIICDEGFQGDYSRVTEFVRRWRISGGQAKVNGFVPLHCAPGEAHQFDWSEEHLVIGGVYRKILAAHLKLCFSGAFVVQAYPSQSHEMLFDAHTRAFTLLGGIPRRGIYDNMKTAVDKVKRGKARIVNTRFSAMASHYLFEPEFCNVASGWEKGVVEKNVQDSRRRLWQEAQQHRFGSFAELNLWLIGRCQTLWRELKHPRCSGTIAEMLELERANLMPMVTPFDGYVESLGKVHSTSLVIADRNRYSAPCELIGQMVSIRAYPERIEVVANDGIMASHVRSWKVGHTTYDWQHYIPLIERKPGALRNGAPFMDMPKPLMSLRQLLIKRDGGDRVMAKVLAAVPRHGLEAVLVAVDLVLETGNASIEHIENVLYRLKSAPVPDTVETALTIREAPTTDTTRYDRLRREVGHA